ncbi:hypothetical protein HGRIS_011039 [Hohenbuehelia grisea]|uniref:Uncharacterized protein n=1 Tax=Hohenbuehelia grisea TaxID=104357 RepID=A0ABR3IYN1_9AGAR
MVENMIDECTEFVIAAIHSCHQSFIFYIIGLMPSHVHPAHAAQHGSRQSVISSDAKRQLQISDSQAVTSSLPDSCAHGYLSGICTPTPGNAISSDAKLLHQILSPSSSRAHPPVL